LRTRVGQLHFRKTFKYFVFLRNGLAFTGTEVQFAYWLLKHCLLKGS
jgi:hypothetical protein